MQFMRRGVPIAPCLHRYARPRHRGDFRQQISDPFAFAVRLTGDFADVEWDEAQGFIYPFGRDHSLTKFVPSLTIPEGSVHNTITNAPESAAACHDLFGGLSVGGFPFLAEYPPYVIEKSPGISNYIVWPASSKKQRSTLIRRKHCYVSYDSLPDCYALVWDKFPGHGLLVNTKSVKVTDVVDSGCRSLFVMPRLTQK